MAPMKVTDLEIRTTLQNSPSDFPALASLLSACITQYSTDSGRHLSPKIKEIAQLLTFAARSKQECESAAKLIFNLLSKAIQDRSLGPDSRKQVVFFVANLLLKVYFRLRIAGPGQFDSISRNIISSGVKFRYLSLSLLLLCRCKFLGLTFCSEYPKADRVGYRYYLGRYYLSQQQFRRSRSHLVYAFNQCTNLAARNKRLILIYLITASLPLGIFPSDELLRMSGLSKSFAPLIASLKLGNHAKYHAHLSDFEDWFDGFGVTLILAQRCEMLLYRCLIRRTFLLTTNPSQKPPNVKFSHLLQALRYSTKDEEGWDLADVECVCVSLIDGGYIRGYIHHLNKVLVLDKRDEGRAGFPVVSGLLVSQYQHDDDAQFAE